MRVGAERGINPWIPPELLRLAVDPAAAPSDAARHRRERRYMVDQPAQLAAAGNPGAVWPVRIRDISPTGLQLTTDHPIPAPAEVRIRWNGRDVRGTIRYNHKYDAGIYRIGVELNQRSDELMRELLAQQSEELRDANLVLQCQAGLARQYALLLDLASEAVSVLAPDGVILFWNQSAERLYGWTRAEVMGLKFQQLIGSGPPLNLADPLSLAGEQRFRQFRKDGSAFAVVTRFSPQTNPAGELEALVCFTREAA